MGSYLQGYGDLMVRTNGWDPGVLEHIATLIPDEWLAPSARGSAEACAAAVLAQFDLGVDGVITAYRAHRPAWRFDQLAANPSIAAPVA